MNLIYCKYKNADLVFLKTLCNVNVLSKKNDIEVVIWTPRNKSVGVCFAFVCFQTLCDKIHEQVISVVMLSRRKL